MNRRLPLVVGVAALPWLASAADWKPEGPEHAEVTTLIVDPAQPTTLFAATNGGGIFKSGDSGATWSLVGAQLAGRKVRWFLRDPNAKGTFYVGLPDREGIWRSTDGAATWKPMRFPSSLPYSPDPFSFVPGVPGGIWVPGRNLHYRTSDGGNTWTEFRVANMDVRHFAFDPKNPKVVWAIGRDDGVSLLKSTDGGLTWKAPAGEGLPKPVDLTRLVMDPASPKRFYLDGSSSLYRTDDDGASFKELTLGTKGRTEHYDLVVENGSRTVYAVTNQGFLKSLDRGESWDQLKRRLPHYYVMAMALHPTQPDTVWAAPGGRGVYVSQDGGGTWSPSRAGLTGGWIQKIWADPATAGTFFVKTNAGDHRKDAKGWHDLGETNALGDEGRIDTLVFDRTNPRNVCVGDGAKLLCAADGGTIFIDRVKGMPSPHPSFEGFVQDVADAKTFFAGGWAHDKPEQTVVKSIDGGVKWKASGRGLPKDNVAVMRQASAKTLIVLLRENGLYRTADGALTWTKAGTGLPEYREIRELVADTDGPNVYVATKKGVLRSNDGGATFSLSNQGLKNTDVESVVVAPTGGRVYAATFEGVFESADAGLSWTALSGAGLVNKDVRALAIGAGRLYAGTAGSGVFSIELSR